jgi:hypothetical protein
MTTTENAWANIPTVGTPHEGREYPVIPTDLYEGEIVRVGDPFETDGQYGPRTKFVLDWELTGGDIEDPAILPQFVTLPVKFLENGYIDKKSHLYALMKALGFDMEAAQLRVMPQEWVGMKARVDVETKVQPDGSERSYIQGLKPPRQRKPVAVKPGPARRAEGWDDDE